MEVVVGTGIPHHIHMPKSSVPSGGDTCDRSVADHDSCVEVRTVLVRRELSRKEEEERFLAEARRKGTIPSTCMDCSKPIEEVRLRSLPGARRCIRCESAREPVGPMQRRIGYV